MFEIPSCSIEDDRPEARELCVVLLRFESIGDALNGIVELRIPGQLRESCEFQRKRSNLREQEVRGRFLGNIVSDPVYSQNSRKNF